MPILDRLFGIKVGWRAWYRAAVFTAFWSFGKGAQGMLHAVAQLADHGVGNILGSVRSRRRRRWSG